MHQSPLCFLGQGTLATGPCGWAPPCPVDPDCPRQERGQIEETVAGRSGYESLSVYFPAAELTPQPTLPLLRGSALHPLQRRRGVPSFLQQDRFICWTDVRQMVKIVCLWQQTSLSLVLFICRMEILPLLYRLWDAPAHKRLALSDCSTVPRRLAPLAVCLGGRSSQFGARVPTVRSCPDLSAPVPSSCPSPSSCLIISPGTVNVWRCS